MNPGNLLLGGLCFLIFFGVIVAAMQVEPETKPDYIYQDPYTGVYCEEMMKTTFFDDPYFYDCYLNNTSLEGREYFDVWIRHTKVAE